LQVLCSTKLKDNNGNPSCHKIKTDLENFVRNYITQYSTDIERLSKLTEATETYYKRLEEIKLKKLQKEARKKKNNKNPFKT
jgi:hypothetical protein